MHIGVTPKSTEPIVLELEDLRGCKWSLPQCGGVFHSSCELPHFVNANTFSFVLLVGTVFLTPVNFRLHRNNDGPAEIPGGN